MEASVEHVEMVEINSIVKDPSGGEVPYYFPAIPHTSVIVASH